MPIDIQAVLHKDKEDGAVESAMDGSGEERARNSSTQLPQEQQKEGNNTIHNPNKSSNNATSDPGSRALVPVRNDSMADNDSMSRERSLETASTFFSSAVANKAKNNIGNNNKPEQTITTLTSFFSLLFCQAGGGHNNVDDHDHRNCGPKQLENGRADVSDPGFACYAPDAEFDPKKEEAEVFMREFDESTYGTTPSFEESTVSASFSGNSGKKFKRRKEEKKGYLNMMERMLLVEQDEDDESLSRMEGFETMSTEYTAGEDSLDESTQCQSIDSKPDEIVLIL